MAVYPRGNVYWYEFILAHKRVRESAHTGSKTVAKFAEQNRRRELEKTLAGMPAENRADRINSVQDIVGRYLDRYPMNHRDGSVRFSQQRLRHVTRVLGGTLLPDLTEDAVYRYVKVRLDEGAAGRCINMELGELSRAIGRPWSVLWPKVRKLEERKDLGRAISAEEEHKLLETSLRARSPLIGTFLRIALLTGMRSGEITTLTWAQVDMQTRVIAVGRAKTSSGTGRQIPMNGDLFEVLRAHRNWFVERFSGAGPQHYLFPFGSPMPADPTRPITDISTVWDKVRKNAGVQCRIHDLRHTVATKMAEAGVPESTMLALMGHMSRAMLERYSHIRMAAKRDAVEALALNRGTTACSPFSEQVPTIVPTVRETVKPN